jgi:ElaB/YqjD/DUF883 family membrane-anchored ribosome-binding protein
MSNTNAYQDIKGDLKKAVHDVQEGFSDLRESLSSAGGNVVEAGKSAVESIKSRTENGVNNARCSASSLIEGASKRIGQRPLVSILVAAGLGFLSGCLISRK